MMLKYYLLFPLVLILIVEYTSYLYVCVWYRLREVSDVAVMQASALQARQHSKDKELEALRRQLLDFQVPGCFLPSVIGLNLGRVNRLLLVLNKGALTGLMKRFIKTTLIS